MTKAKTFSKDLAKFTRSLEHFDVVRRKWRYLLPDHKRWFMRHMVQNALPIELEELKEAISTEENFRALQASTKAMISKEFFGITEVDHLNSLLDD